MIAMGVAFLSNSIHDPDGNMMNRKKTPSLGNGSDGSKKKKKRRKKDRQSKKLKKEIGGALKTLQQG